MVAEQRRSGGPSTASICRSEGAPPLLQPRPDLGQVSRLPEPERTQTAPPARGALADATGIVVVRGPSIVSRAGLAYDGSVDDGTKITAKITQLAAVGIIARDGV